MKVGVEDESKKYFETKRDLRKATMKYCRLVVLIRHDSAEIWGFRYELKLVIGTLKYMASNGVCVRVVCAIKNSIKNFPSA
jgi:hypothetical protein